MTRDYQIEQINYDLIQNAINISPKEKNRLYGHSGQFIAARPVRDGYHILIETLGKRDECSRSLQRLMQGDFYLNN
ncbi:MAG: hypothetical protein NW226_10560 [Microscillaceae bacterium]|nr:hypothetical protein [Microscillaceae bacterium]